MLYALSLQRLGYYVSTLNKAHVSRSPNWCLGRAAEAAQHGQNRNIKLMIGIRYSKSAIDEVVRSKLRTVWTAAWGGSEIVIQALEGCPAVICLIWPRSASAA